jgi:hypothetical protein
MVFAAFLSQRTKMIGMDVSVKNTARRPYDGTGDTAEQGFATAPI